MKIDNNLAQQPPPGTRLVKFRGDTLTFTLTLLHSQTGSAWVRSNLGHARLSREEIIREIEHDETRLGRDWYDIPMHQIDEKNFAATLPILFYGYDWRSNIFYI